MSLRSGLVPLRDRSFRLLFTGRLVSVTGSTIAPVALAFAVLDLTRSPAMLGVVLAAGTLPQVVFLLAAGVLADRLPRGRVMVASNTVSCAGQAAAAVLLLTHAARPWHLAALAAVTGTAGAFFGPAAQGILPQIVAREYLRQANALLRLSLNIMKVLGPALGGVLVAAAGPGWGIACDAASFAVAATALARLRVPASTRPRGSLASDLRDGWSTFWSRTWLWGLVLQYSLVNLATVGGFLLLGPVVAQRSLGGATAWGLIVSGLAAGLVLGAVLVLGWQPHRPLVVACLGTLTKAAPLIALATTDTVPVLVASAVAAGVGTEMFVVSFTAVMQQRVPVERLSRVSSYDMLFGIALVPVAYLITAPISAAIGIRATLWSAAALIVVSTALVLLQHEIRHTTRPSIANVPLEPVANT